MRNTVLFCKRRAGILRARENGCHFYVILAARGGIDQPVADEICPDDAETNRFFCHNEVPRMRGRPFKSLLTFYPETANFSIGRSNKVLPSYLCVFYNIKIADFLLQNGEKCGKMIENKKQGLNLLLQTEDKWVSYPQNASVFGEPDLCP